MSGSGVYGINSHPGSRTAEFPRFNRFDFTEKSALDLYGKLLGARLAQLRLARDLSQADLGRKIRCSTQLISAWETGRRTISIHVRWLVILAAFYEISIAELLDVSATTKTPVGNHRACVPGNPAMCGECLKITA